MDTFRRIPLEDTDTADVVIGLCPGCELWQVDYTNAVQQQYMKMRTLRSIPPSVQVDPTEWHDLIEDILAEHLMECRHLQRLLVDR